MGVEEEMKGEVTAWLPDAGEKFPHNGEKPERELLATLDFSLKMHQDRKYGEANTIHFDFKPQTRSDIQSESELIFGSDPDKIGLDPLLAHIEPLDLQLTPTSASLNLTRIASDWQNLPENKQEIPTDPKTMFINFGCNMIINVLYVVAMFANRM